jgi:iron(III) transport system substrate-binding protein
MKFAALPLSLCLMAASAPAAEVNVYSARQPDLIQPLFDAFTAKTGITVNTIYLDKGLIERLQAEGDRTPADLVLTVDIANLEAVVAAGVTQEVQSDVLEAAIAPEFRDDAGHWFGLTARARVVYASAERVAEGDVTTYEDLADPKWKGRICIRSGLHNYNLSLLSAYVAHHGAEAAQAWAEGLKANLARTPEGGDRDQAKAVWAGLCDIAIGNTYYVGQMMNDPEQKAWAEALRVDFPVFEGGGTHVNISGVAMTAAAPNRDNALALMEYLAGEEAQGIYAALNHEYPLVAGIAPSELVAGWGSPTPDALALDEIGANRDAARGIMETINFDG